MRRATCALVPLALALLAGCGGSHERECTFNSDCSTGRYCTSAGACTADCTTDSECVTMVGAGAACSSFGMCVAPPDAGGAMDAGGRDAGEAVDAGGPDDDGGALVDAGSPDTGPADAAACAPDASLTCTAACGTTGTAACTSGAPGPCVPPAETCNGVDDDCDGTVDNGFRAGVLPVTYSGDLTPLVAACPASGAATVDCNAAISRFCAARGCTTSGHGPVEIVGDAAQVDCIVGDVVATTYAVLATRHGGCDGTIERYGPTCNAAIHRECGGRGYPTGFGPLLSVGPDVSFVCVPSATAISTTYTTLATHHGSCDGVSQRMGIACNSAIHRFCVAAGYASGFGPLEHAGDGVQVGCVTP